MALNRELWEKVWFEVDALPDWPSPCCQSARLKLDAGGLSGTKYKAFRLKCIDCDEIVLVSGLVNDEENLLQPVCFLPTLNLFPLSNRCPSNIAAQTRQAFSLYWSDKNAAGNRIRASVELILDHLKIKKNRLTKINKRQPMTLHDRILEYHPKNPDVGEMLLAIKWVGNIGSHRTELKKVDLLDDLEMLEFVHDELFTKSRSQIQQRAKLINRNKGKIRR